MAGSLTILKRHGCALQPEGAILADSSNSRMHSSGTASGLNFRMLRLASMASFVVSMVIPFGLTLAGASADPG
jgi:hypothetical protein